VVVSIKIKSNQEQLCILSSPKCYCHYRDTWQQRFRLAG